MKKCNVCNKQKPNLWFKQNKKTCRGCERTFSNWLIRLLVIERRLTPQERLGNRLGYMGSAYLIGAILSLPQVWLAKQWNLVIINFNLLIGYGLYLYNV